MMRKLLGLAFGIAASILLVASVSAGGPVPASGTANVDGDDSEWTEADFFADMYEAARPDHPILSKLYLRYDCQTETLYARVRVLDSLHYVIASLPEDSYIKIGELGSGTLVDGNSGDDGTPPDFAWVGLYDGGAKALGWEASISLQPGDYNKLNVHTQVGNGEPQTSAVDSREIPLEISADCQGGPTETPVGPSPALLLALACVAMLAVIGLGVRRMVVARS